MKMIVLTMAGAVIVASFVATPRPAMSDPQAPKNWREFAKAGDYASALRTLDSARSEVVKQYTTAIEQALPKRIGKLNPGKLYDHTGIAYLEIATMQTYAGAGKELRVDLQIPILNVDNRTQTNATANQFIKAMLGKRERAATDQMEYLMLQGYLVQIRRDSIFAAKPQMLAYLSNGATITIHAITDIPIDEFKKIINEVPLQKIDSVISGTAETRGGK